MKTISQQINQYLKQAQAVIVVIHTNPDGDAIGSATAMFEYIQNHLKKDVDIFYTGEKANNLNFLNHYYKLTSNEDIFKQSIYDTLLILDTGDLKRAQLEDKIQKHHKYIINIDHHKTNQNFGHINLVNENASATAEILYHFFHHNSIKINEKIATSLLTGIITDTDNFSNSATTTTSLNISGELLRAGANLNTVNTQTVKNKTIENLKIWGIAFERLVKHPTMDLTYTYLKQTDFKKNNLGDAVDGVTNFLNNLNETKIAAIFKEVEKNKHKVSFRTTDDRIDVAKLAQKLGGGGHKKASGFTQAGTVENILKNIEKVYNHAF